MNYLLSEQWKNDVRVGKAKQLLNEALLDYRARLDGVRSANPELEEDYVRQLHKAGELRGRELYFPYLASGIGNGALVELADGSVKYDFISGIGVHYMGHSHPKLLDAAIDAAMEDTIMQGNLQQNLKSVELMERLMALAGERKECALAHCFLTSSGAMANENAFKIIFQKKSPASRFLAFERCFSGRTLAAAQMTCKPEIRVGMPKVLDIDYIPFFDSEDPQGSTQRACACLHELLAAHKGEYAGMCFELIQGEGGYYPGQHDFFVALMGILKSNDVAVMVDEIQTFGRTTEAFAFQYFELDKYVDVVTIGKMSQVCATLFTRGFNPKPGLLSQTFTSSTVAIHAACVILEELCDGGYLGEGGKIAEYSRYFTDGLEVLAKKYPSKIQGSFGFGAMVAMTVFDGSASAAKEFVNELYAAGVLSFMAGKEPSRVRFLMPIGAVTKKDIDAVCKIIEGVI